MAPTTPHTLGQVGERLALEHYERLGFEVLERNYRTRSGEIDLVVCDRATIAFVEVKTRRAGGLDPMLALTPVKIRRLRATAAAWLASNAERPRRGELRFDAVAIVIDDRGALLALEQIEDIA